ASLPPAVLARSCDSLYLPVLEWHRRTIRPMRHNRGREHRMPLYLTRFSYTPATWAKLIEHPEDRRNAATQYIEAVGGKLHGFWYAFGEYDAYTLYEAPDNVAMAANSIAIGAGGALSSLETVVLLSVEKTLDALERARAITYRSPGSGTG